MSEGENLDIGEVSRRSGLPASTLRYYEERGLIQSVGRHGLRRQYDESVMQVLALISLGRLSGFSLDEIADMFTDDGPKIDREQLKSKADELNVMIKQLTAMRDGLRHAAECPAPSHMECPTFQKMLKLAERQFSRQRGKPGLKVGKV